MMLKKIKLSVFLAIIIMICLNLFSQSAQDDMEIANMIRSDKFNYVLPKAMRNNNIDMWIIIDEVQNLFFAILVMPPAMAMVFSSLPTAAATGSNELFWAENLNSSWRVGFTMFLTALKI